MKDMKDSSKGSASSESFTHSKGGTKMPLGSTGSRKQPVDGA